MYDFCGSWIGGWWLVVDCLDVCVLFLYVVGDVVEVVVVGLFK